MTALEHRKPNSARFLKWVAHTFLSNKTDEPERNLRRALDSSAVAKSDWADAVGLLYTESSFAALLDWPSREVEDAGRRNQLMFLVSEEGDRLYPAAQVNKGRVVPGLPWVLNELSTDLVDRYSLAAWMNVARDEFQGHNVWFRLTEDDIPVQVRAMVSRWKAVLER